MSQPLRAAATLVGLSLLVAPGAARALDLVVGLLDAKGKPIAGARVSLSTGNGCETDACGLCRMQDASAQAAEVRIAVGQDEPRAVIWKGGGQGKHWHAEGAAVAEFTNGHLEYHFKGCGGTERKQAQDELVVWLADVTAPSAPSQTFQIVGASKLSTEPVLLGKLLERLAAKPAQTFHIYRIENTLAVWSAGKIEIWRDGHLRLLGRIGEDVIVESVLPLVIQAAVERSGPDMPIGPAGIIEEAWIWPQDRGNQGIQAMAVRFVGESTVALFLAPATEEAKPIARTLVGLSQNSIAPEHQAAFLSLLTESTWLHGNWYEAGDRDYVHAEDRIERWDLATTARTPLGVLRGGESLDRTLILDFVSWLEERSRQGETAPDADGIIAEGLEAIVAVSGAVSMMFAAPKDKPLVQRFTTRPWAELGHPIVSKRSWSELLPQLLPIVSAGNADLEVGQLDGIGDTVLVRAKDRIYGPGPDPRLRLWGNATNVEGTLLPNLLREAADRRKLWKTNGDPLLWEQVAAFGAEGVAVRFAGATAATLVPGGDARPFPVLGVEHLANRPAAFLQALTSLAASGFASVEPWEILKPTQRLFVFRSGPKQTPGRLYAWESAAAKDSHRLELWGDDIARTAEAFEAFLGEADRRATAVRPVVNGAWATKQAATAIMVARFTDAVNEGATLIAVSSRRQLVADVDGLYRYREDGPFLQELAAVLPQRAVGDEAAMLVPLSDAASVFLLAGRTLWERRPGRPGFVLSGGPIDPVPGAFLLVLQELSTRQAGFDSALSVVGVDGLQAKVRALFVRFAGDADYDVFSTSGGTQRYRVLGLESLRAHQNLLDNLVVGQIEWQAKELSLSAVDPGWVFVHDGGDRLWAGRDSADYRMVRVGKLRNVPGAFANVLAHLARAVGPGAAEGLIAWSHTLDPGADGFAAVELRLALEDGKRGPFLFPVRNGAPLGIPLEILGLEAVSIERELLAATADLMNERGASSAEVVTHAPQAGDRRLFLLVPPTPPPKGLGRDLLAWKAGRGFVSWGRNVEKIEAVFDRVVAHALAQGDKEGLIEDCRSYPRHDGDSIAAMGVRYAGATEHQLFTTIDRDSSPTAVTHLERVEAGNTTLLRAMVVAAAGSSVLVLPPTEKGRAFVSSTGLYGMLGSESEAKRWAPVPPPLFEELPALLGAIVDRAASGVALPVVSDFPLELKRGSVRAVFLTFNGEKEVRVYFKDATGFRTVDRVPGFQIVRHLDDFLLLYLPKLASAPGNRFEIVGYPRTGAERVVLWEGRAGQQGTIDVWEKGRAKALQLGELPRADIESLRNSKDEVSLASFISEGLARARAAPGAVLWNLDAAGFVLEVQGQQPSLVVHVIGKTEGASSKTLEFLRPLLAGYLDKYSGSCGVPASCKTFRTNGTQQKECLRALLHIFFRQGAKPSGCQHGLHASYLRLFQSGGPG